MLKKIKGYIVYSFIITLLIFCCTSLKSNAPIKKTNISKFETMTLDERYEYGSTNFVFLLKEHIPKSGCEIQELNIPCTSMLNSTASGFIFSHDKGSIFVMTAAHFCKNDSIIGFDENIIGLANSLPRNLFVIDYDEISDICMLVGTKYPNENFIKTKIAESLPKVGEEVYTVAAPNGIMGVGIRLIFEGKFGGCFDDLYMSTIPATFGSSGAGIFNKKGELVTIVMAVTKGFEHVTLSPSHDSIKEFVDKLDRVVDIYP